MKASRGPSTRSLLLSPLLARGTERRSVTGEKNAPPAHHRRTVLKRPRKIARSGRKSSEGYIGSRPDSMRTNARAETANRNNLNQRRRRFQRLRGRRERYEEEEDETESSNKRGPTGKGRGAERFIPKPQSQLSVQACITGESGNSFRSIPPPPPRK